MSDQNASSTDTGKSTRFDGKILSDAPSTTEVSEEFAPHSEVDPNDSVDSIVIALKVNGKGTDEELLYFDVIDEEFVEQLGIQVDIRTRDDALNVEELDLQIRVLNLKVKKLALEAMEHLLGDVSVASLGQIELANKLTSD